jgi:hypothetical protein
LPDVKSSSAAGNAPFGLLGAFTVVAIAVAVFAPPIAQPPSYHAFADARAMFGVPNFLDVVSNAGFAIAGVVGMVATFTARSAFHTPAERTPYAVFFAALILTALGSAWYHLDPDNDRLFWDRLPMTVAFVSLVCAQIGDRVDPRVGVIALVPLVVVGAATVVYWRFTERVGEGNLVPYGVLQLWALGSLVILALRRSRYTLGGALAVVIAAYFAAKLCEHLDRAIFVATQGVSGHTLKHVIAAVGGLAVAWMIARRAPVPEISDVKRTDAEPLPPPGDRQAASRRSMTGSENIDA